MSCVLALFCLLLLGDALRLRARIGAIPLLEPGTPNGALPEVVGVASVPSTTVEAAGAWMDRRELDLLEVLPQNLDTAQALAFLQLTDPTTYRSTPLHEGRGVGQAVFVRDTLVQRAALPALERPTLPQVLTRAIELKRHTRGRADIAISPEISGEPMPLEERVVALRQLLDPITPLVLGLQGLVYLFLVLGVLLPGARVAGLCAVAVFHLHPVIVFAGTRLNPSDLLTTLALRLPLELAVWAKTVWGYATFTDPRMEAKREEYQELLAEGTDRFFETTSESCPICEGQDIRHWLTTPDLTQGKPGEFTLTRCGSCSHIFQNPRLTVEGLNFYYKDYYDGIGEASLNRAFEFERPYHSRVRMMQEAGVPAPSRWLDVGCGHGHFCRTARGEMPDTRFEGLDLSEGVELAHRRGWIDEAHRGLFPEVASKLDAYGVVSMHHYLEHTLDPIAEIDAASQVLEEGGHFLIEVPDPSSPYGRWMGRFWLPWFQPQHLNLVPKEQLERLLVERHFEIVQWDHAKAHGPVDLMFSAGMIFEWLAPSPQPWRPRRSWGQKLWRGVVWGTGLPLVVATLIGDVVLGPWFRRYSPNTMRVLARKSAGSLSKPMDAKNASS